MHQLLYVTFDKENAKTPEEARRYAHSTLEADSGFVGEGSRFSSPVSDWFVIGGRWSGALQFKTLDEDYFEKVKVLIPSENTWGYDTKELEKHKEQLQRVWEMIGGKGENPYNRNTYDHYGKEDDSAIVDKKIYDKILKQYQGSDEASNDGYEFVDLDYTGVEEEEFIGKKWIVVVDYHS